MGAADEGWLVRTKGALAANGEEEEEGSLQVAFGLATAFELRNRSPRRARALLPLPSDSELPPSVAERLRRAAEESGCPVVPAGDAARRPRLAALSALGAVRSISVVVPNYNYARYIEERLRQIGGQTYPVTEILVLDDASTDDSVARIQAALPGLQTATHLIANRRNSGSAFRQWERGVRAAKGELVWIAEADDQAAPEFLAHLTPAFDDPAVVMAQSQSRQVGVEGELRHEDYGFYLAEVGAERWLRSYRTTGREQAVSTLAVMNTIPNVSAVLFRRETLLEALDTCLPVLETFRLAGDWLVYLEVLSRGDFAFVRDVLNDHRVHEASVTASALSALDRVREVARMQKIARDRVSPPPEIVSAATAYLQKLYDHFGLNEGGPAAVYQHSAFAALAPKW